MSGTSYLLGLPNCRGCGKRCYRSRKEAKQAIHAWHRGDSWISAYRCETSGTWHVGHLPAGVRSGDAGRAEVYREAS